jgi:hypothetical protein
MFITIEDFKKLPENIDKKWALAELKDFVEWINTFKVDNYHGYSESHEKIFREWYLYIYEKLKEYGFVNGQPEENTWEKLPKAVFWWSINCTTIEGYHLTSREVQEKMIKLINEAISYVNLS